MKSLHTVFLILALSTHFCWADGEKHSVKPPGQLKINCTLAFKKFILPRIVPNFTSISAQSEGIPAIDEKNPTHPLKLHIGNRIGFGMKGGVYRIDSIDGDHPALARFKGKDVKFVFKSSHQGRFTGAFRDLFQKVLLEEEMVYASLDKALPEMEKDAWYPKDPSWKPGTLPFSPVIMEVTTQYGAGLIKLEIPGQSVKDLALLHKKGKLSPEVFAQIKKNVSDWYDVSQAASNHAVITPLPPNKSIFASLFPSANPPETVKPRLITSLDINPENMVWVTDPVILEILGSKDGKTPMLGAYELGEPALTTYRHQDISREDYYGIWKTFGKGFQ